MRMGLGTFQQLKSAERVQQLLDPERQAALLAQMMKTDPEAAAAFKGMITISDKGQKQLKEQQAVNPNLERIFEHLRACLTAVNDGDYAQALIELRAALAARKFPIGSRSAMVPIGQQILQLDQSVRGLEALAPEQVVTLVAQINEQMEAVISAASYRAETMQTDDFGIIEETQVELPWEISEPTYIEGATLLVQATGLPIRNPLPGTRPLAGGIFLVESLLLGVPRSMSQAAATEVADQHALKTRHCHITRFCLTRPDSSVFWFPMFPYPNISVEKAMFPEQSRRYYGIDSNEQQAQQDRALRREQTRQFVEEFKRNHAHLYEQLENAERVLRVEEGPARELGEQFRTRYGVNWSLTTAQLEAAVRRPHLEDLELADDDLPRRQQIRQRMAQQLAAMHQDRSQIVEVRARLKNAAQIRDLTNAQIDRAKEQVRDPYGTAYRESLAKNLPAV